MFPCGAFLQRRCSVHRSPLISRDLLSSEKILVVPLIQFVTQYRQTNKYCQIINIKVKEIRETKRDDSSPRNYLRLTLNLFFFPKLRTFPLNCYNHTRNQQLSEQFTDLQVNRIFWKQQTKYFSKLDTNNNEIYILGDFKFNLFLKSSYFFESNSISNRSSNTCHLQQFNYY